MVVKNIIEDMSSISNLDTGVRTPLAFPEDVKVLALLLTFPVVAAAKHRAATAPSQRSRKKMQGCGRHAQED